MLCTLIKCYLHNVTTMGLSQHSRLGVVCTDPEQVQSTVQQSVIMHQRLAICVTAIALLLDKKQLTVSANQRSWLHRRRASALAVGAAKFPSHQCSPVARSAPCRCWLSAHKQQRLTQTGPEMFAQMDVSRGSEHILISTSSMNCQPDSSIEDSAQKQQQPTTSKPESVREREVCPVITSQPQAGVYWIWMYTEHKWQGV